MVKQTFRASGESIIVLFCASDVIGHSLVAIQIVISTYIYIKKKAKLN